MDIFFEIHAKKKRIPFGRNVQSSEFGTHDKYILERFM